MSINIKILYNIICNKLTYKTLNLLSIDQYFQYYRLSKHVVTLDKSDIKTVKVIEEVKNFYYFYYLYYQELDKV